MGLVAAVVCTALAWALPPVDVNAASASDLDRLLGIGPTEAERIVAWRDARGPCTDPKELLDAPGVGEATWRAVRSRVVCGPGPVPEPVVPVHPTPPSRAVRPVNINRADEVELQLLAGMSPERARRLLGDRETGGDYASCRDVARIPGFGPATVAAWGDRCTVTDAPPAAR